MLFNKNIVVDTIDLFDQSLIVLKSKLKKHSIHFDPAYIKQNQNSENKTGNNYELIQDLIGKQYLEHLTEINSQDYELLSNARKRLKEQYSQLDHDGILLQNLRLNSQKLDISSVKTTVSIPPPEKWIIVESNL
ncbi:MAG: hypothetical protein P9M03_00100 [Candidatus Theseobacter exili]|nr:hypothetical protein [Candidatus Theseobacter exili]